MGVGTTLSERKFTNGQSTNETVQVGSGHTIRESAQTSTTDFVATFIHRQDVTS